MDFKGIFQGVNALIALVYAFLLRDPTRSGWQQYKNFYGFLLNSSFLTFFISSCFIVIPVFNGNQGSEPNWIVDVSTLCFMIQLVILMPPFITHFFPGLVVYFWMLLILYVALAVFAGVLTLVGRFLGFKFSGQGFMFKSEKYNKFVLETTARAGLIFCLQTFFTYMVFYYAYAASDTHDFKVISGEHYLGVVSHEYNLRSQTACNFQHALSDVKNGLVFFSWL